MLQLLLFSGLAFFLLLPMMRRTLTLTLDVDWFYRKAGSDLARLLARVTSGALAAVEAVARTQFEAVIRVIVRYHGPSGILARTFQAGSMVLWVMLLLAFYLVMNFL